MYSIEDIENMCSFDIKNLSYMELDSKYKELSETLLDMYDEKKSTFSNDTKVLKYAYRKLMIAIQKINYLMDYYDKMGQQKKIIIQKGK